MKYLLLFYEFFKTGLFSVGGGLATLPFLYDMGERMGWFTASDVADMLAISESTPGPIGINMATYAGFNVGGIPGALVATAALTLPAIIIIIIIAKFLAKFNENRFVKSAFYGLRPAVVGLISAAALGVMKIALLNVELFDSTGAFMDLFNLKAIALFAVLTFGILKFKKHPIIYIAIAAVAGVLLGL